MKKILSSMLFCAVLFGSCAFAWADGITVNINGSKLETPVEAQIVNNRTVLPMRAVFEALGAKVEWIDADRLIFATKGNKFITLKIGIPQMSVQTTESVGNKIIELDTAPFIDSGYTLVPVRAAAEALDAGVEWIEETKTVEITK